MEVAAPIRVRPVVEFVPVPAPEPIATAAPSLPPTPKAAKPVRPVTPLPPRAAPTSRTPGSARTVAAAAAVVVVVAAIGFPLGKLWLGHQEAAPIIREDQPSADRHAGGRTCAAAACCSDVSDHIGSGERCSTATEGRDGRTP